MYWEITKEFVTGDLDLETRVGTKRGSRIEGLPLYEFRMYDDDDELYYVGRCDAESFMSAEDLLYEALKFGEWDAGATDLRLKLKDVLAMLRDPNGPIAAVYKRMARPDGWVTIYS